MSSIAVGGNLAQSASAIIATASRGYHILKIDGYSRTKGTPTGELIKSTHSMWVVIAGATSIIPTDRPRNMQITYPFSLP
jgi:hypothetical protein